MLILCQQWFHSVSWEQIGAFTELVPEKNHEKCIMEKGLAWKMKARQHHYMKKIVARCLPFLTLSGCLVRELQGHTYPYMAFVIYLV